MYNNYFRLEKNKERGFTIEKTWIRDFGDIAYNIRLYENNENIADVVISLDETIDCSSETTQINEVMKYIENSFDEFKNLPKLSKTSRLLQSCFDDVYSTDSDMCHITQEDWNNYYIDNYSNNDVKILKDEINKYRLNNVLEIDNGEYKIIGYGDLITLFNDDRNLLKENIIQIQNDLEEDYEV